MGRLERLLASADFVIKTLEETRRFMNDTIAENIEDESKKFEINEVERSPCKPTSKIRQMSSSAAAIRPLNESVATFISTLCAISESFYLNF